MEFFLNFQTSIISDYLFGIKALFFPLSSTITIYAIFSTNDMLLEKNLAFRYDIS